MGVEFKAKEIDIDIGVGEPPVDIFEAAVVQKEEPKKQITSNPMLEEIEEEEGGEEYAKSLKGEEADFYESLTDVEKEAWDQNWRKGKFFKGKNRDGTPREEISAEQFLERSKKLAPIAIERARKVREEKAEIEKRNVELEKQLKQLIEYNKKKEEREVSRSVELLDREEEEAILEGDLEKVKSIRKRKESVASSRFNFDDNQPSPAPAVKQPSVQDQAIFNDWLAVNDWYGNDNAVKGYADGLYEQIKASNPAAPLQEILKEVEQDVRQNLSLRLGLADDRKPITVGSGSRGTSAGRAVTISYNDLPAQTRATCEKFIKLYKYSGEQANKMRANYVKEYK